MSENHHSAQSGPRLLPHSLEAEANLLSCCLLDDGGVVASCIEARLTPASFYEKKNGVIFECVLALHRRGEPVEISVIASELKKSHRLDLAGGFAYLGLVSQRIPTTAQAGYFIKEVQSLSLLREMIRNGESDMEECRSFSGDVAALLDAQRVRRDRLLAGAVRPVSYEMPWDTLLSFDSKNDPDCFMGNRFLGRSGAAVIVAPSGVGKSVLALQLALYSALGRPFFGMKIHKPMRVLYVQAEDDTGDVAETVQGYIEANSPTPDDLAHLKERVRIVRWNDAAGDRFLERLRREHGKWPFDLVVINPLFSFCGCNVSEQKELSPFLRNGLNPILNETRAAAVIVHHTNKPPTDDKKKGKELDEELRYSGSGSAELTNWARAYITLKSVGGEADLYRMAFVKRGKRAGILDEAGEITTKVFVKHSRRGLCWLPSDYRPDTAKNGQFQQKFGFDQAVKNYVSGRPWAENKRNIAMALGVSERTVERHKTELDTVCE